MLSNIQEILERSIFHAIKDQVVKYGYLPDITNFNITSTNSITAKTALANYELAIKEIVTNKGYSIEVFNYSSNEAKGTLKVPRIVIDTSSVQPGQLGGDTTPIYELVGNTYIKKRNDTLTSDFYFTIFVVGNNVKQMRTLISLIIEALPRRGYIKSYLDPNLLYNNNLFIQYLSSGDTPNLQEGIMEKSYSYLIPDVFERLPETIEVSDPIVKIEEINLEEKFN